MSFSAEVKEELSKLNIFNNIEFVKAELFGYLLTSNANYVENKIEFITENQFNIERFYKILFKLNIDYEPEMQGKNFKSVISKKDEIIKMSNGLVEITTSDAVIELQGNGKVERVITQSGKIIETDLVVICVGVTPNTEIAKDAGIELPYDLVRNGEIIGRGFNTRETEQRPTGHAELIAIEEAAKRGEKL